MARSFIEKMKKYRKKVSDHSKRNNYKPLYEQHYDQLIKKTRESGGVKDS